MRQCRCTVGPPAPATASRPQARPGPVGGGPGETEDARQRVVQLVGKSRAHLTDRWEPALWSRRSWASRNSAVRWSTRDGGPLNASISDSLAIRPRRAAVARRGRRSVRACRAPRRLLADLTDLAFRDRHRGVAKSQDGLGEASRPDGTHTDCEGRGNEGEEGSACLIPCTAWSDAGLQRRPSIRFPRRGSAWTSTPSWTYRTDTAVAPISGRVIPRRRSPGPMMNAAPELSRIAASKRLRASSSTRRAMVSSPSSTPRTMAVPGMGTAMGTTGAEASSGR